MMKEGFDKEIDSLLRRRARSAAGSFADGDGNGAATHAPAHLDADELGAFAEGALPSGARLAAASHLADCDRCRGVVVALSRALGGAESKQLAAAVPASTETPRPAPWRVWAATLFSPRALRYAAPVLALSVVAVVSFVALRTRNAPALRNEQSARPRSEVAQQRPDAGGAASGATAEVNQPGLVEPTLENGAGNVAPPSAATTTAPSAGRGPNAGEPQPASPVASSEDAPPPPPPAPSTAGTEAPAELAKSAPKPVTVAETAQPPAKSDGGENKEKGARGAEPVDELAANDAAAQQQRRAASRAANEVQMPDGGARGQRRGADNNASNIYGGNTASSAPSSRESERDDRRAGGATAARRGRSTTRAEQRADDEAVQIDGASRVETRTAAGHRFRREGSAWVDVNYKPSMRSTGVRRGTEAFRALVADVPVVGRVAEQIGGEVVVVVGGQAYRIR
ncbi:MAG TPA: hypothetical protein VF588_07680 [Pyrinomonadaceae bacterium]|jgi:hypothetical protein